MVTMIHPNPSETAINPFEQWVFQQFSDTQNPAEADWLQQRRQLALDQYIALGFPTRKQEAWKTVNLKAIAQLQPSLKNDTSSENLNKAADIVKTHSLKNHQPLRLTFIDGQLSTELSDISAVPEGLMVSDLRSALTTSKEVVEPHFGDNIRTTQDAFAALNFAAFTNGAFVHIAANYKAVQPVQLFFITTASQITFNRNLVVAEAGSQAFLSVHHINLAAENAFNHIVTEVLAKDNATVEVTAVQDAIVTDAAAMSLLSTLVTAYKQAEVKVIGANFSGKANRHQLSFNLLDERAHAENACLNVLKGNDTAFIHSEIHHQVPNCTSNQLIKNILDDKTTVEFNGTIFVHKDAQQTDAQQLSRGLLLSDSATIYTRPQLQIDADDVKCAHGATVGQLNPDELFYLASRGIEPEVAQCLLTFGFAEDVVSKITSQELRNQLSDRLLTHLGHEASPVSCFAHCDDCDITHATHV